MLNFKNKNLQRDEPAIKGFLVNAQPLRSKTINVDKNNLDQLKSLTVLYVEDDDETRDQYSQFLSRMVGVLVTAKDGAEGLAAYHENQQGENV